MAPSDRPRASVPRTGELAKPFRASARRSPEQGAFMHGAHTESNICLWMAALARLRRHIVPSALLRMLSSISTSRSGSPTTNTISPDVEQTLVLRSLVFSRRDAEFEAEGGGAVSALFVRQAREMKPVVSTRATGIPMCCSGLSPAMIHCHIALSVAIIQRRSRNPEAGAYRIGGPADFGTYDVSRILFELALHADSADCDTRDGRPHPRRQTCAA